MDCYVVSSGMAELAYQKVFILFLRYFKTSPSSNMAGLAFYHFCLDRLKVDRHNRFAVTVCTNPHWAPLTFLNSLDLLRIVKGCGLSLVMTVQTKFIIGFNFLRRRWCLRRRCSGRNRPDAYELRAFFIDLRICLGNLIYKFQSHKGVNNSKSD